VRRGGIQVKVPLGAVASGEVDRVADGRTVPAWLYDQEAPFDASLALACADASG